MRAAENCHLEIVQLLLSQKGININARDIFKFFLIINTIYNQSFVFIVFKLAVFFMEFKIRIF